MKKISKIFLATTIFFTLQIVQALDVTITTGIENPISIAIIPFSVAENNKLPIRPELIITDNLERSGRFKAVDPADFPQYPSSLQAVNFKDWRLIGIEGLIIGSVQQIETGEYNINFRLIDIYQEEKDATIVGLQLTVQEQQLRTVAHEISDIIYEKLVGVRGAFATNIAYVSIQEKANKKKRYTLHISDSDGYNSQILLRSSQPILSPSWSPDGRQLAYVSFEEEKANIFVQDISTGKRQKIASNKGSNSAPAWSPDGSRIAMTLSKDGNAEIYIMDIASKQLQRITNNKAIDTEASWSSDGKTLVFTSDRGGGPQIYKVDTTGGKPQRLTFIGSYNARPRYSSDNNLIAMVTIEGSAYKIATLDLRNGIFKILTQSKLDESPSFSPNDHMIIYTTTNTKGTSLAAVSVDGLVHQRLALQNSEVREPVWGPFLSQEN